MPQQPDYNENKNEDRPLALSAKRCPKCGKIVSLQTPECGDCGHQFRTRFQDPMDRTQAFDAVLLPRAPQRPVSPSLHRAGSQPGHQPGRRSGDQSGRRSASRPGYRSGQRGRMPVRAYPAALFTFGLAFLGSFSLVALLGLGVWMVLGLDRPATVTPIKPVALASTSPGIRSGDAQVLYDQITLSMSLYDLDQAAGGLGRVIHSSDPHMLMLSYDYPGQSVRVSLHRMDAATDDYRVQAFALYRGQLLLHRTSAE